jgi:hypothetical protein
VPDFNAQPDVASAIATHVAIDFHRDLAQGCARSDYGFVMKTPHRA